MILILMSLRLVWSASVLQVLPRYGDMTSGFSPPRMKHRQPLAQQASAPAAAGQALGTATLSHGCLLTFAPDTCILRAYLPQ